MRKAYNIGDMDLKNEVFLQLYRAGKEDVSGEELANRLSVSRAAVWKAVQALREEGYSVSSATNRGYRLNLGGDAVDFRSLSALLDIRTICKPTLPSTNTFALSLETKEPVLIVANEQTKGKARRGKEFPSPAEKGLYFTYLFFPRLPLTDAGRLTDVAVLAVARAIGGEAREQEVYLSGTKKAGVLTEFTADTDRIEKAAVGVGIYTDGLNANKRTLIADVVSELKKFQV